MMQTMQWFHSFDSKNDADNVMVDAANVSMRLDLTPVDSVPV